MRRPIVLLLTIVLMAVAVQQTAASTSNSYHYVGRWPEPTWHMGKLDNDLSRPLVYGSSLSAAVDPSGNVYICDTANNRVLKHDASGHLVASFGSDRLSLPGGIALNAEGTRVYVADTNHHQIVEYTSAGVFQRKWGNEGGSTAGNSGNGLFKFPEGVAVDQLGYVYVADTQNHRVQKFSANGGFEGTWGYGGSGPSRLNQPSAIAVGPDGKVWVLDRDSVNFYVQRFNQSGDFELQFGGVASGTNYVSKFYNPKGLTVDAKNRVWVTDNYLVTGPRIQEFDASGGYLSCIGGYQSWDDYDLQNRPSFHRLDGIVTFESNGATHVLACDSDKAHIREFDDKGTTVSIRGSWGKARGRMTNPGGVGVTASGDVLVADTNNHRVDLFSGDGTFVGMLPSMIPPYAQKVVGGFDTPQGISVAGDDDVYVIEAKNNRVQKLSSMLGLIDPPIAWGANGNGTFEFNQPSAIAAETLTGKDRVYVADTGNDRIQVFDVDENPLKPVVWVGTWGVGVLSDPAGIAVAPDHTVYVADTGNSRVVHFSSGGAQLNAWGTQGSALGQFRNPHGVAVGAGGLVFVADTDNDRVQVFEPSGIAVASFGGQGAETGQLSKPRGVAISDAGLAYVADSGNHRIQYFSPPVVVSLTGISDGEAYNQPVTPVVRTYGPYTSETITLGGAPWTPAPISAEGQYTVTASASNSYGDTDTKTATFVIDTTAPTTTCSAEASYENAATIDLSGVDPERNGASSGIDATYYRLDGVDHLGSQVTCTQAGDHTLVFWSVDKAGNEESHSSAPNVVNFTVLDTVPPVTTSDAVASYIGSATIRLTATDGSGVAQTLWRLDGGAEKSGPAVSASGYGNHTLEFWSVDTQGLSETHHFVAFKILRKTVATISRSTSTVAYNGSVTLRATLKTESGSYLKGKSIALYRSFDGKSWSSYRTLSSTTGGYAISLRLQQNTYYKFRYQGDSTWAACSSQAVRVLSRAYLTTPVAPSAVVRNRSFAAYGYLRPRHETGAACATLYCYRSERGIWVLRKKVTLYAQDYSTYSRYRGSLSLPYAGSWRIRSYHSDPTHTSTYTGYRYLSVK